MIKLNLWQVDSSEKAYLFSTTQNHKRDGKQVWIPRSMIEHVTRLPERIGEWQQCIVTLPEWIAEKKGLL